LNRVTERNGPVTTADPNSSTVLRGAERTIPTLSAVFWIGLFSFREMVRRRRLIFLSLRSILTMGYFAHPPVLRQLRVAPFAIDTPVCDADLLFPPIGKLPADISYSRADLSPPTGEPLAPNAPLHHEFAEPAL